MPEENQTPPNGGQTPPASQTPPSGGTTPPANQPPAATEDAAALKARLEAAETALAEGRAAKEKLARMEAEQAAAEQKRLEQQGEWQKLAEQRAAESTALQKRILTERVRSTALAQGLIDDGLVSMIPTDDSFLVNGEPNQAKIDQAIAAFKSTKAHFFRQAPAATQTGAGGAPPPAVTSETKFDFSKLEPVGRTGQTSTMKSKAEADALFNKAVTGLRR